MDSNNLNKPFSRPISLSLERSCSSTRASAAGRRADQDVASVRYRGVGKNTKDRELGHRIFEGPPNYVPSGSENTGKSSSMTTHTPITVVKLLRRRRRTRNVFENSYSVHGIPLVGMSSSFPCEHNFGLPRESCSSQGLRPSLPLTRLNESVSRGVQLVPMGVLVRLGEYRQHRVGKHGVSEIFNTGTEIREKIYAPCL